eukprot:jgi/Tetstr1/446839/TSEL_034318.t1
MHGSDSPTGPKMVDAGKVAAVEGVETLTTAQARIKTGCREAEDAKMRKHIQEQLSKFFATKETPIPPATAGDEDAIPGGNESHADAACVTDGIAPAFGQRFKAIVHTMEAVDDCHRFRLAYLRKHLDTQMHNGDTLALDVVWGATSALAPRTWGRPRFKNARPARGTVAPRTIFAKDVTKDSSKGKAKAEAPTADKAE